MQDPATLPKPELLKLLDQQAAILTDRATQLDAQQNEIARREDVIRQLEAKIAQLERDYLKLWQERFAAKSERYIQDLDQLRLEFAETADAADAADAAEGLADAVEDAGLTPPSKRRKPRKKRDESLPAHLPRRETIIDPSPADTHCDTHGEKKLLPEAMWDVVERLTYVPPQLYVEVRKYRKYACEGAPECGIASAERPTGIVEGDKYDASVAAELITNKFAYYLPVYCQQDLFADSGWTPSRSTMLNILTQCYFVLIPLLDCFRRVLQGDTHVACDDTGITLLYPKEPPSFDMSDPKQKRIAEVFAEAKAANKPSINAKMWAYRGQNLKLNVFDFTVSRHRDGPEFFFQDYTGTLLRDCWHGFEAIAAASDGAILRAACNSHARRKFENATDYPDDRKKWLAWYQDLFDIETRAKVLSEEERLHLRQTEPKPIWEAMRAELDGIDDRTKQVVLPKSDLRKALNYLTNHWTELTRYLDDPKLPIDNNECEHLMRPVVCGRKNWLFTFHRKRPGRRTHRGILNTSEQRPSQRPGRACLLARHPAATALTAKRTTNRCCLGTGRPLIRRHIREYRRDERRDRDERKQTERAKRRARKRLLANRTKTA